MIIIAYKTIITCILLVLALVSDLQSCRIRNTITYGFMLVGTAANITEEGFSGLLFSLQGIILPVLLLMIFYIMRAIGAGDLKLISAVGAVMGAGFAVYAAVCSFIFGGIIAAGIILFRHNGMERLKYFITYIKSCILSMELLQYMDFNDKQNSGRFHFSIAIASGTVAAFAAYWKGLIIL